MGGSVGLGAGLRGAEAEQAILFEAAEGFSDRCTADVQLRGHLVLRNVGARPDRKGHDTILHVLVCLLAVRG